MRRLPAADPFRDALMRIKSAHHAFTLVEIMIVVAIIALLAVIAVPSFLRARQRARDSRLMNAYRIATDAFQMYAAEHNGFPPDAQPGEMPVGMDQYFGPKLRWTEPTPVGGVWDWDNGVLGIQYGVSVDSPDVDTTEMQTIDAALDDGNLSTGRFRFVNGDRYTAFVE